MLRFKLFHLGAPVPLSDSQPMLKRMGLKVLDERPHRISPPDQPPVWMHDFGMQTRAGATPTSRSTGSTRCSRTRSARIFRGEVENDDFNRLVVAARHAGRRDRRAASLCEIPAADRLPAVAGVHRVDARRASATSRAISSSCSRRGSIPDARPPASDDAAACRSQEIESALDGVENLSEDRVLRQYLALILATTRTNFWRRDAQGRRAHLPVVQVRSVEGAGSARAAADVRDLRLLAALRGRPPARRPGRARRPALVGPARGFPHRDPGPREGADGEERRHRPGGLERRLRAEARAGAPPIATRT